MNKKVIIITGFVVLKFVLQFLLIHPVYELHRDEFLHLDQGNHLAWGYISVPPLSSWVSYVIRLLGNGIFWVRFFPALFGAVTILLVCKTIEALKGSLFAIILGGSYALFSVLLRLNGLFHPNSMDVLCWTSVYYFVVRYIDNEKPKWLYFAAVAFAIGVLNKYNIVFLLVGLIPALMLTPQRKIFFRRDVYLALGAGLVLILPNLFWQYRHQFPVLWHMQELRTTQLVNVNRGDFPMGQFMLFPAGAFVIAAAFYALLFYAPFRKYRFFFWCYLFTIGLFFYFKAKSYYSIGLYPVYLAFGAVFLANIFERRWGWVLRFVSISLPVLLFLVMLKVAFPNKSPEEIVAHRDEYERYGLLRWEDGRSHTIPQDFADMLGWKELAHKTDSLYAALSLQGKTLVFCDGYWLTGAVNYYSRKGIRAISFDADYVNWIKLDTPYVNLIRVINPHHMRQEVEKLQPLFQRSFIVDSITSMYAREHGAGIAAFIEARVDLNGLVETERVKRDTCYKYR
ncbi:glycosyltransferase family 39 protein [Filimonas effusa]|uniref:Glycosyltransferase family 39 protein n=1 Tax=Filimonas effusa TaxID=2508721 RepID=A0A4Q1DE78_9BACT|nr:glycosyltransferase family 39 protein [Filimonas effusa]RXK87288.1 glycosyltransferase family 39 protein [Filimonas effusa]